MITAVDSNVLIDIFGEDPVFFDASSRALTAALANGTLVCSDVVYAEVAAQFGDRGKLNRSLEILSISCLSMSADAAFMAGAAWKAYRKTKGKRERMVADFLVGAHAYLQCDHLLTRDRGFYRKYFSKLSIIDPIRAA
jgi:predicted nucleic acid-binding protein